MRILDLFETKKNIGKLKTISKQEAIDRGLFGPVYHGSSPEKFEAIMRDGFKIFIGSERQGDISNGYPLSYYDHGLPAPVHHLGFGVYFTTSKNIAKNFNGGTTKNLHEYYLDVPNLETINFGSTNTMMKWWRENGYEIKNWNGNFNDPKLSEKRIAATKRLTQILKSKFDAVWYKGKGLRKLLDGDQVCVYDPRRIYLVDKTLSKGLEIGAKVKHNQKITHHQGRNDVYVDEWKEMPGWRGIFRIDTDAEDEGHPSRPPIPIHKIPPEGMRGTIVDKKPIPDKFAQYHGGAKFFFTIKWQKGGTLFNYYENELEPLA